MRKAGIEDVEYIASAMIRIPDHIEDRDPYVAGLPAQVSDIERGFARNHIADAGSIVLIEERDDSVAGCLLGYIDETSFPPSGVGSVGHISLVWVEPQHRGQGVARALVEAAQSWFADAGLELMELSYLASNSLADRAWAKIGFAPFRTFAWKRIRPQ